MDTTSHYVSITLTPRRHVQGRVISRRASRLFEALHLDRSSVGPLPINLDDAREDAKTIGKTIFVFGTQEQLETLLTPDTRTGKTIVADGLIVSDVTPVPADAPHVVCRRIRVDEFNRGGVDRARRRAQKRGHSPEVVQAIVASRIAQAERPRLVPSFRVPSRSTSEVDGMTRSASVYVDVQPAERPLAGEYTSYGLSRAGSTVPLVYLQ